MAKRPDTLETVQLAIELLRRIPRHRKITAAELHQQLRDAGIERELRTIQRQLEMLSEHFEIERDERSKPYGYRWLEQARALAVPTLTPQESLLLQLAEEHLRHLLPPRLMGAMSGFFSQARRNLGHEAHTHLERQWPYKVRVVATSQPLLPPRIRPGVFDTVSQALYANCWLELDYQNANGKRSRFDFMPLGLVQQGVRLYIVGRYRGFDNERNLALNRIHSAEMSTLTFERPKGFDLKQYDDEGRFGFGEGRQIRLCFCIEHAAGLHLLESPLSTDQQASQRADGLLEISATVVDSAMLDWWLRGFGSAVREVRKQPL
ncbi:WYL domain-containing protein [Vandammella animalimorsus]|uniref:WYL domain-containing protein n=1 Tax=Vandammella animalimorsus TaxID=2029117 RepID=A0A2A2ANB3_9BURK|nr:WYL domain-containing protein [Vandammella animalimorsus]PAT39228.1 WYL domain-containing protein [Vandammella animalimorsus]